jgi:hypothetical protein
VQAEVEQVQFFKPLAPHHLVEEQVQAQQLVQTERQTLAEEPVVEPTLLTVGLVVQE